MSQNVLVGKILLGMMIAKDKEALLFCCEGEDFVVTVDADCCSYTWIEHVELPALGFPALVYSVDYLEMPDLGTPAGKEYVQYYGCKISTDRGDIVIDYRNDSNGYYGGSLSWPEEFHYGGVYGQANSEQEWVDILEMKNDDVV